MKKINLIALLVGFLVIALGVLAYVNLTKPRQTVVVDRQVQELSQQSSSDELEAIEADINETDLDNLDQELVNIESELKASD